MLDERPYGGRKRLGSENVELRAGGAVAERREPGPANHIL